MNIVAIVQARMGSTRLPAKIFLDLAGEPVLARVVRRLQYAQCINKVVVATTQSELDKPIIEFCRARNFAHFCGSEEDVLDRYYQAAKTYSADLIIRITADCPLIDPDVVDLIVHESLQQPEPIDYACNVLIGERTFPRGQDTEVLRFETLERVWREDTNPAWREHVTLYIRHNPTLFRLYSVRNDVDYSYMRWTLDTQEDYQFLRKIYEHYGHDRFGWQDVVKLLEQNPSWAQINQNVEQKPI